jgi:hypothetical protein
MDRSRNIAPLIGVCTGMTAFAVTYDYRCPFARNAHEHVVAALRAGAEHDVAFVPFSLGQVHVEDGQTDIWDRPDDDSGLLALRASVVVRDRFPDRFLDVHEALFALRHDKSGHLRDEAALRSVLHRAGVDHDAVFDEVTDGWPLDTVRKEHERAASDHSVWGVPTFIAGEGAVFVRLMNRPHGDADLARRTVDRVIDLLTGSPELNEFKHTSIPR